MTNGSASRNCLVSPSLKDSVVQELLSNSTTAQFRAEKSRFQLEPLLSADEPFVADLVTLPDGSYKGHKALILKPAAHFHFTDLPAELRVEVYKHVFGLDDHDVLHIRTGLRHKLSAEYLHGTKSRAKWAGKNRLAILGVCRQLRTEALPVLYQGRVLSFETNQTLCEFLKMNRGARGHLVDIQLIRYQENSRFAFFRLLRKCRLLRNFEIKHVSFSRRRDLAAKRLFNDVLPWIRSGTKVKDKLRILSFAKGAIHCGPRHEVVECNGELFKHLMLQYAVRKAQ